MKLSKIRRHFDKVVKATQDVLNEADTFCVRDARVLTTTGIKTATRVTKDLLNKKKDGSPWINMPH